MNAFIKQCIIPIYFLVLLTFIIGGLTGHQTLQVFTKPLLMPLLMLFVFISIAKSTGKNIILAALFFSFAGDVFLLFESKNSLLFIPGLVAFLLTHILYIIYFFSIRPIRKSLLKTAPYLCFIVLLYGVLLLYFLFPHLGALKVPVIIYALIILLMLIASIHIYSRVKKTAGILFIAGAIFFIISDSLLAINKFHTPLLFPFFIILTYGIAQYLLIRGFTQHSSSNADLGAFFSPAKA